MHDTSKGQDTATPSSNPTKDAGVTATCDDVINVSADAALKTAADTAGTADAEDAAAEAADAHVLTVSDLKQELQGISCKLQRSGSSIYDLHSKRLRYVYLCISALASTLVSWTCMDV
jgi:hypothetical protein